MSEAPLVSTVIPTRNRPKLVKRAVSTALNQTYSPVEVVVVVDGPDPLTAQELAGITE
jgi:glycosyltransferase involved in cell wall biosynthesis